ncbi:YeeE/YedE family protein [Lichenicoccus roseus]|uniref:YeeE/YedE family protein n=1 Tax=Lichenicoccus roseus TaxID=2683649 RepID=UPI002684CDD0
MALLSGILFGLGLALSGMMDPARVLGFLDPAGSWDPTLAFVLGGAVAVSALSVMLSRRMTRPLLANRFDLPTVTRIDRPLLVGAGLFGIGWGLSGFCPGPALASLSLGLPASVVFVIAMLIGMVPHDRLRRSTKAAPATSGRA